MINQPFPRVLLVALALLLPRALSAGPVLSIATPAAAGAMGPALAVGPDGAPHLSWLEPVEGGAWAMKSSRFDALQSVWGPAQTITQGSDLFTNWADFPQLAIGASGRLTAVWFVNNPAHHGAAGHHGPGYRAIYSHSSDRGRTWSPDLPVSDESLPVEFVALQPLHDGRVLAAWLDGRANATASGRMRLYARILDGTGTDVLVDDSVCDCCQISLVPTDDDGALLAYRGRTDGEVRDIQLARFDGKAWAKVGALHADGWKIPGCPVNGPQLAQGGERVGAVWFTAANEQARVFARVSADGGATFGAVARVDRGRPQGRVDGVMLADGTFVMTWLELTGADAGREGGIYLRTISPTGQMSDPQLIAPSSTSRMSGFPRMAVLGPRRLLLTCTQDAEPSRVLAFRIDLD